MRFEHITTDDGLPNNTIRTILQDRQGFMWIGTWNGLARYDGRSFKVYKHDHENPTSITDSHAWAIVEEPSGGLWVGTAHDGLNRFDPATDTFTPYRHDPENPNSLGHSTIRVLLLAQSGALWIGLAQRGLDKFDPATQTFTHYPDAEHSGILGTSHINALYEDASGLIWIGATNAGLVSLNPETEQFTSYQHDPNNPQSLGSN